MFEMPDELQAFVYFGVVSQLLRLFLGKKVHLD